jgi:uncharacterized protein YutE (UPF0331/DUF86 family)
LERLDESIRRLKERQAISLAAYRTDWETQDVVERNFQVAIECCTDIASHLLVSYGLQRPSTRKDVFRILADAGYLDPECTTTCITTSLSWSDSGPSPWESSRRSGQDPSLDHSF